MINYSFHVHITAIFSLPHLLHICVTFKAVNQSFTFMIARNNMVRGAFILIFLIVSLCQGFGQNDYKLKKFTIKGNKALKTTEVKEAMSVKVKSPLEKLAFWTKSPRFSQRDFNDGILRLTRLYQRNGFLSPTIEFKEDKNDKAKSVKIELTIREGESVSVGAIGLEYLKAVDYAPTLKDLDKELPLHAGNRFVDEKVTATMSLLQKKYADNGYPFATVSKQITASTGILKADLSFRVDPGDKSYFGKTEIMKDSIIPESFIRNRIKYKEGEPYSKKLISESQQKLYDSELFKYVVIRPETDSLKEGRVPMTVQFSDKPRWSLKAGAGYGSEDKMRFTVQLTRRQFLGGARKLIFTGKSSYTLPVSLELSFIQPDFLMNNLNLILNPFYIKENQTSYEVERLGGGTTLQYNFTKFSSIYLMYLLEQDHFFFKSEEPMSTSQQDSLPYNKSGYTLGFTHNTTKDLFNPESGFRFTSYFTWMGAGFNSKYHYLKLELEFRKYVTIKDKVVWAGRIRTGAMKPIKQDEATPIEDRFMLGGALSLRGWGKNQISPKNEYGDLVGGNSMLEVNSELRFPIYQLLSGAAFIETGNVWASTKIPDFTDLRTDFGLGLRVSSPIGPLRIDFANPIFENVWKPMFFVTIGHSF